MLGEILGQMAQAVPGYVEGRQQAIKDNWQDLSNYNQVQAGQMNNLFTLATMPDRLDLVREQANQAAVQTDLLNNNYVRDMWGLTDEGVIRSERSPFLRQLAKQQALNTLERSRQDMLNLAWVPYYRNWAFSNGLVGGYDGMPYYGYGGMPYYGYGADNNIVSPSNVVGN